MGIEIGGRTWRRYDVGPLFAPFWWADHPDGSPGGLMAFCPGEILLMEADNELCSVADRDTGWPTCR